MAPSVDLLPRGNQGRNEYRLGKLVRLKTLRDQALLFLCAFSVLAVGLSALYFIAAPERVEEHRFSYGADALAYLLPCVAALTAGLGVFLGIDGRAENAKARSLTHRVEKRLYFISMVILYFGVIAYVLARPCRIPGTLFALECEIVSCALVLKAGYKAARARKLKTFRAHFGARLLCALVIVSFLFFLAALLWPGVLFTKGYCTQ